MPKFGFEELHNILIPFELLGADKDPKILISLLQPKRGEEHPVGFQKWLTSHDKLMQLPVYIKTKRRAF